MCGQTMSPIFLQPSQSIEGMIPNRDDRIPPPRPPGRYFLVREVSRATSNVVEILGAIISPTSDAHGSFKK